MQAPGGYQSMLKCVLKCDRWNDFVTIRSFGNCSRGLARVGVVVAAQSGARSTYFSFLAIFN